MKPMRQRIDHFFQAIPDYVRKKRGLIWFLFIAMVIGIAPGVTRFQLDLSDEFFFAQDNPVRLAYDKFRAQFGGDESIYIVYRAKDGDIFSRDSLKAVRGLQEELANYRLHLEPDEHSPLDRINEITTIVNISYLEASEDALVSRQFIGDKLPQTTQEKEAYRQAAIKHPDYPLMYVSDDNKYGGILIRTNFKARTINQDALGQALEEGESFDFDVTEMAFAEDTAPKEEAKPEFEAVDWGEYAVVMHAVEAIINKPEYTSALEYYPVGIPPMNAFIWDNFIPQINGLMMLTILLVIIGLWLLFRSLVAVVWPMLIVSISSVLAIAVMGWFGLKMNLMVNVTVLLVLVVGVADAVHILSGYLYFRNQGQNHRDALNSTYEKSGLAVFLTSLTTAIGMMALWVVQVKPIQHFGLSAALGVFFAFVITVFILPLMLDLWHPISKRRAEKIGKKGEDPHLIQSFLQWVEPLTYKRPHLNVSIFAVLTIIFAYGITKIEVDSNPISIFAEGNPLRDAYDLVDNAMGGTTNLEIMIDAGEEGALQDPELLNALENIQDYLAMELADTITVTRSLVNIVKDSNKALNGGREEFYSIPQDPAVLRQTLFLFNNANPSDRRKVVSDDYRKAHITVNLINQGSKYYIATLEKIKPVIDQYITPVQARYPQLEITLTGSLTMFSTLIDFLSWSQIKGFGLALLIISAILLFIFQSYKIGVIALFPNLFPLILVFGIMGYMGISLDVDTLIVAPLMIGIIVDDTIHFLTHYRAEVAKDGDIIRSIVKSLREVGQAITFTSIILALAFLAFMLLEHQGLSNFGFLSAIAIVTALAAELFLLPALLILAKARVKAHPTTQAAVATP